MPATLPKLPQAEILIQTRGTGGAGGAVLHDCLVIVDNDAVARLPIKSYGRHVEAGGNPEVVTLELFGGRIVVEDDD